MKILKEIGGFIVLSGPLFPLLIYFIIAVGLSIFAAVKGAKRGRKRWGVYVFLVYLLIMFWDLPIVLSAFEYECKNNAGFTVHKTLEQWQEENPGVAETLVPYKVPEEYLVKSEHKGRVKHYRLPDGREIKAEFTPNGTRRSTRFRRPDGTGGFWLNQRFIWETFHSSRSFVWIGKKDQRIIDRLTGEVMAQRIDFSSSAGPDFTDREWNGFNPQHLKVWLWHESCPSGEYPNPKWLVGGDSFGGWMVRYKNFDGESR